MENKGTARFYRDKDGAGRLYIPKRLVDKLGSIENGEQLKVTTRDDGTMLIEKL